jgi:hypothetical protein
MALYGTVVRRLQEQRPGALAQMPVRLQAEGV